MIHGEMCQQGLDTSQRQLGYLIKELRKGQLFFRRYSGVTNADTIS